MRKIHKHLWQGQQVYRRHRLDLVASEGVEGIELPVEEGVEGVGLSLGEG